MRGDKFGDWKLQANVSPTTRHGISLSKRGYLLRIEVGRPTLKYGTKKSSRKIEFVLWPSGIHIPDYQEMQKLLPDELGANQSRDLIRAAVDWAETQIAKKNPRRKKNPGKPVRLKNPRTMPDPGPMSWLGTTLEWKWQGGQWKNGKDDWLFLWSPKYKAVVAVKCPKKMDKLSKVSRSGGAAKMFERFMSRDPKATYEAEIPACKLVKLGKAIHIVYRSDKWKHNKKTEDYIHEFGKGVELYCGPSKQNPEVFLCFGGKLTATERGLVF